MSAPSSKACVVAFHLAVLEAIEESRKNGCHPVTVYQTGPGEYGSVDREYGPEGSVGVCRISAVPKPIPLPTRTWTEHTFTCQNCHHLSRASREAIDEYRREMATEEMSDAEIAASFDYCLRCCDGKPVEGERVEASWRTAGFESEEEYRNAQGLGGDGCVCGEEDCVCEQRCEFTTAAECRAHRLREAEKNATTGNPSPSFPRCLAHDVESDDDEIACPVGDPDCLGGDGDSHEACEAPGTIAGVTVARNPDAECGGEPSLTIGDGWTVTLQDVESAVDDFGSYSFGPYNYGHGDVEQMLRLLREPVAESQDRGAEIVGLLTERERNR